MDRIESPIFLVGSVRSGTTLLGDMLDHHPDIAFPGEFELAVDFMGPHGELPDLVEYHAWLELDRHFLWHGLEIDPSLDYRRLVRSFLGQMASRPRDVGKPWVGVTVHRHYGSLVDLWPAARFIHLVRDPRDVGASIIVMGWAGNPYTAARQWSETEEEWERTRSRIPEERRFEVRFEDLAADPRGVLARICEFAGLPYREEMMSYPEDSTYEEVDPRVIERWRRNQSPGTVQLSEAGAGAMLERKGYEPSGHPKLTIGPLRERWLRFHCRLERFRRRIRTHGLGFWIQRRTAMALGLEGWTRRLLLREHEITNRSLK